MAASKYPTAQYTSDRFIEAAGAIAFKLSTKEVCLLHWPETDEWLLAKGRRNVGESRAMTAVREFEEETGYKCRLLPVVLTGRQPVAGQPELPQEQQITTVSNVCEPFMAVCRTLADGTLKMIWWYVAAIDEDAAPARGEETFQARLFDWETALQTLTFQPDREVVKKAIDIIKDTDALDS